MVLSEEILKVKYRKNPFSKFYIENGTVLTPSAKQIIADKGIELIFSDNKEAEKPNETEEIKKVEQKTETIKYFGTKGEYYSEKPDYMTQTDGNILILKNNKKIIFRGKIETFLAELLLFLKELELLSANKKLQEDMLDIVKFVNNILLSENLNKELEEQLVLKKSLADLQKIARNPLENLGFGHLTEIKLGEDILVHKLNRIKALARELETYAVDFYVCEDRIYRKDLLQAFNVLSSAIYIIMLKMINRNYEKY
ncbi:MAG: ethanolamine utilization protein [Fusobacterium sp.]|nr:ethanolamine utilization protein [Fusobacterium sp.]